MEGGIYCGLSCPATFDETFYLTLSESYLEALVIALLERFETLLTQRSEGVINNLQLLAENCPGEALWLPGSGRARHALYSGKVNSALCAAALILLHTAPRKPSNWKIRFQEPVDLIYDAELLRDVTSLHVEYLDSGIQLRVNNTDIAVGRSERRFLAIPSVWTGRQESLLMSNDVAERYVPYRTSSVLASIDAPILTAIQEAYSLLQMGGAEYYIWVSRAVRRLLITTTEGGRLTSGTIPGHFGEFFICAVQDPCQIAEMLVHECSHQYYNLLASYGPMVDPDHKAEYYSPFPRRNRPLERLLLAYHAFANVLGFYKAYKPESLVRDMQLSLIADLKLTEETLLKQYRHLTDLGRGIFIPLQVRHGLN